MPNFAANLTMLYNEHDFIDRFAAAAADGFAAVEYLFPYAYKKELLAEQLEEHRLTQALHNMPAGDWAAGERGIACIPGREEEFRAGVVSAIEYATALGCRRVNCLAGIPPKGVPAVEARRTFVENLEHAAPERRRSPEGTHPRGKRPDRERAQTGLAQRLRSSGDEVARVHPCAARELDRLDVVVGEQLGAILPPVLGKGLDPARHPHVAVDAIRARKLGVDRVANEAVDEGVLRRAGDGGLPLAAQELLSPERAEEVVDLVGLPRRDDP